MKKTLILFTAVVLVVVICITLSGKIFANSYDVKQGAANLSSNVSYLDKKLNAGLILRKSTKENGSRKLSPSVGIDSYDKCVAAGYPVRESYPSVCVTPDGKSFVNPHQSMPKPAVVIDSYAKCVAAGYPVRESYPSVCVMPNGKTFTNPAQRILRGGTSEGFHGTAK